MSYSQFAKGITLSERPHRTLSQSPTIEGSPWPLQLVIYFCPVEIVTGGQTRKKIRATTGRTDIAVADQIIYIYIYKCYLSGQVINDSSKCSCGWGDGAVEILLLWFCLFKHFGTVFDFVKRTIFGSYFWVWILNYRLLCVYMRRRKTRINQIEMNTLDKLNN